MERVNDLDFFTEILKVFGPVFGLCLRNSVWYLELPRADTGVIKQIVDGDVVRGKKVGGGGTCGEVAGASGGGGGDARAGPGGSSSFGAGPLPRGGVGAGKGADRRGGGSAPGPGGVGGNVDAVGGKVRKAI